MPTLLDCGARMQSRVTDMRRTSQSAQRCRCSGTACRLSTPATTRYQVVSVADVGAISAHCKDWPRPQRTRTAHQLANGTVGKQGVRTASRLRDVLRSTHWSAAYSLVELKRGSLDSNKAHVHAPSRSRLRLPLRGCRGCRDSSAGTQRKERRRLAPVFCLLNSRRRRAPRNRVSGSPRNIQGVLAVGHCGG